MVIKMSRWSKRSQEEKEKILQKLDNQKRNHEKKEQPFSSENIMDIYKEGEIPIFCHNCCKFQTSDRYIITKKEVQILGETSMVEGICRKCGKPIEKYFPRTMEEIAILELTFINLKNDGRLEDRRK